MSPRSGGGAAGSGAVGGKGGGRAGGDGGVNESLIKHTKIGRRFGLQRAVSAVKFIIAVSRGLGSPSTEYLGFCLTAFLDESGVGSSYSERLTETEIDMAWTLNV